MAIQDDWIRYFQEQGANAEKWARENPVATGIIIIVVASVGTIVASKAYDAWTKS